MREFGKPKGHQDPVRTIANDSFPAQAIVGELFTSTAIVNEGVHAYMGDIFRPLGWRGEQVYSEGILSKEVKVFKGIHTKLPLNYVRNQKWASYYHTAGHFEVKPSDVGTYLFMAQITHDAANGNLFIMKNGEIVAMSTTNGNDGITTQTAFATEPVLLGDKIGLYFMTLDDDAIVYNDFYNTRLLGVKMQ